MHRLTKHQNNTGLLSLLPDDFKPLLSPFMFRSELDWPEITMRDWMPSVDVKEEDARYVVYANLPGVKIGDIDVSVENSVLTIKGFTKSKVKKEEEENFLRLERSNGSFLRQLQLPEAIDEKNIHAKCCDGVLEITLPKTKKNASHKIKIEEK